MSSNTIQNVLVIGATGSVGPAIVDALLSHPQGFNVSILTRPSSLERTQSMFFNPRIRIYTVDYSSKDIAASAFESCFQGQDAIVSATATFTVPQQKAIIDAAIAVGTVKRFIPSEYGVDTADSPSLAENLPAAYLKTEVVEYLKRKDSHISWSAVCTGAFFDWSFQVPGNMGWDIPSRTAMIFDGGDVPYEATNIAQIGSAVAATLSDAQSPGLPDGAGKGLPMVQLTRNNYIYVNSFTLTQNEVLKLLERYTNSKFQVNPVKGAEVAAQGKQRAERSVPGFQPVRNMDYADGVAETILAAIYGNGDLNHFSRNKVLWNQGLGLYSEDVEKSVEGAVKWWNSETLDAEETLR